MKAYENRGTVASLDELANAINIWAESKGFNRIPAALVELCKESHEVERFVTKAVNARDIALMHSELSEQLEGQRKESPGDLVGFSSDEEELADLIIRALHYAGKHNLRIGSVVAAKMAKNEGRPYLHGKAF